MDRIDDAIGATEAPTHVPVDVEIASSHRKAALLLPADLTEAECIELAAWILIAARAQTATRRGPGLTVVRAMPEGNWTR